MELKIKWRDLGVTIIIYQDLTYWLSTFSSLSEENFIAKKIMTFICQKENGFILQLQVGVCMGVCVCVGGRGGGGAFLLYREFLSG